MLLVILKKYTRKTTKKSMFCGKTTGKREANGKKAQCYYYFYMEYKCILIHRSQSEYENIKFFHAYYTMYIHW